MTAIFRVFLEPKSALSSNHAWNCFG